MTAVSARNFLLSTSGANVYNATFSGNLTGDNTNGLIKTGTGGTITLSGTNTYTGNTTVSEGTLALGAIGQLKFLIGASGVNNTIAGVGTLNLNGSFLLDLTSAGTAVGNSWNLVNVGTLTETFNTSFSVVGFTEVSNVWSQTIVPGLTQYEFSEGTGVLSVVVIPEPGMFGLIGVGVIGLLAGRRRRSAK